MVPEFFGFAQRRPRRKEGKKVKHNEHITYLGERARKL